MIELHVIELELGTCKHNRYIRFDLDDGKGFCYRSRVSSGAFFHHFKKPRNRSDKFLYSSQHLDEFQHYLESWARMKEKHPDLPDIYSSVPVVDVKNIWEFYELIGYDYKTKKWI